MEKNLSWILLERQAQLDDLIERSYSTPCLIFKHSTKCFISDVALARFERNWNLNNKQVFPYFLDVMAINHMSVKVSEVFEENHETPQILLINKGECVLEATDMDIHVSEVAEMLADLKP